MVFVPMVISIHRIIYSGLAVNCRGPDRQININGISVNFEKIKVWKPKNKTSLAFMYVTSWFILHCFYLDLMKVHMASGRSSCHAPFLLSENTWRPLWLICLWQIIWVLFLLPKLCCIFNCSILKLRYSQWKCIETIF